MSVVRVKKTCYLLYIFFFIFNYYYLLLVHRKIMNSFIYLPIHGQKGIRSKNRCFFRRCVHVRLFSLNWEVVMKMGAAVLLCVYVYGREHWRMHCVWCVFAALPIFICAFRKICSTKKETRRLFYVWCDGYTVSFGFFFFKIVPTLFLRRFIKFEKLPMMSMQFYFVLHIKGLRDK